MSSKPTNVAEPADRKARYFADFPHAVPTDQATCRVVWPDGSVKSLTVSSLRYHGHDYVRLAGALFTGPMLDDDTRKAAHRTKTTVLGVITPKLIPAPSDRVHDVVVVPAKALRSLPQFERSPGLLAVLDALKKIADRNAAGRARFAGEAPAPKNPPAPVSQPAPPPVKGGQAGSLADRVKARLAAQAQSNGEASALEAKVKEMEGTFAALRAGLEALREEVLEAYLLDTDAERSAALAVIAERLTT